MANILIGVGLTLGEFLHSLEHTKVGFTSSAQTHVTLHVLILDASMGAVAVDGLMR